MHNVMGFGNAPRCLWRTSWNAATSKGNGRFFIKVALTVAILLMAFPTFLLLSGVPVSFGFLGFDGSLVAFAICVISLIVLIWKRDMRFLWAGRLFFVLGAGFMVASYLDATRGLGQKVS